MAIILMSSTSFAMGSGCNQYAEDAADAEQDSLGFYSFDEWKYAYNWYISQCYAAGGADNIDDPVFL